jgi:hypothetical protein
MPGPSSTTKIIIIIIIIIIIKTKKIGKKGASLQFVKL